MKGKALVLMLMLIAVLPTVAQDMSIVGFAKKKGSLIRNLLVERDSKQATLLLSTDEKGFTFKADGTTEVQAEQDDGRLIVKVPHKTRYLTITHPDYGQMTWRVPSGSLRKKKIYHAYLQTYHPDKEYKLRSQWVTFRTIPAEAIVQVDSMLVRTMSGEAQFYLPEGRHPYTVESPFYQPVNDTLEITPTKKLVLPVQLQPVYSYLQVSTPHKDCRILVDNQQIGFHEAVSQHLSPGEHRLSVFVGQSCYYDAPVTIGAAEKKVVTLTLADLREVVRQRGAGGRSLKPLSATPTLAQDQGAGSEANTPGSNPPPTMEKKVLAPVKISTPDSLAQILVDREVVGRGSWEGKLGEGFHLIHTRNGGEESTPRYLWVENDFPLEIKIGTPQAEHGLLNIHSNVIGASVFVNDRLMGLTPCIVKNLPAGETMRVRLEMACYKPVEQKVLVMGNDMVDVDMRMKKK